MAYYDPSSWINKDDQLLPEIEYKLKSDKKTKPQSHRLGKAFIPPNSIVLSVIIRETNEILRLTEWIDTVGKINIELTDNSSILRQGHFNHSGHHNPNGTDIPPPHHIHFPTKKYPNPKRRPAYAYLVKTSSNYLDALIKYCTDTNIQLEGAQIPGLLRRPE